MIAFPARALRANESLPLPICRASEMPGNGPVVLTETGPENTSGMLEDEAKEKHLQKAICSGSKIPTLDCEEVSDYEELYTDVGEMPKRLVRDWDSMLDEGSEGEVDYDLDTEDEEWVKEQPECFGLTEEMFEKIMYCLEQGTCKTVMTLDGAKAVLKDKMDEDVITGVYEYWLNKRLKTKHPLTPQVRIARACDPPPNNPYFAFKPLPQQMRTRKQLNSDKRQYQKLVLLRQQLGTALNLLGMVRQRETIKRELISLSEEIFYKKLESSAICLDENVPEAETAQGDDGGEIVVKAVEADDDGGNASNAVQKGSDGGSAVHGVDADKPEIEVIAVHSDSDDGVVVSKTILGNTSATPVTKVSTLSDSSDDEISVAAVAPPKPKEKHPFAFRRKRGCNYLAPIKTPGVSSTWRFSTPGHSGIDDKRLTYHPTSLKKNNALLSAGLKKRRMGRGGRVFFDRAVVRKIPGQGTSTFAHPHASQVGLVHYRPASVEMNWTGPELQLSEESSEEESETPTECSDSTNYDSLEEDKPRPKPIIVYPSPLISAVVPVPDTDPPQVVHEPLDFGQNN